VPTLKAQVAKLTEELAASRTETSIASQELQKIRQEKQIAIDRLEETLKVAESKDSMI